jgi:tRNA dimethylallyltransferase
VRAHIEDRYAADPARAHTDLEAVDPAAAAKIDPLNLRRSVRALEVVELTGEPFSAFAGGWEDYEPVYEQLDVRGFDLPPADLRQRIRSRAEAMVDSGLVDEVRRLARLDLSGTAREAIGYQEALEVLAGNLDEDDLAGEIARRTWRYAKRQRSWFKKDPRVQWQTAADVVAAWSG